MNTCIELGVDISRYSKLNMPFFRVKKAQQYVYEREVNIFNGQCSIGKTKIIVNLFQRQFSL